MTKPIPVLGFALSAFAFTHPGFGAGGRGLRQARPGRLFPENPEAERFATAWQVSPFDRRNFTVCVRASQAANAPGFRLLTCAEPQRRKFEYVWLHEIEEILEGFAGIARETRGGLTSVIPQSRFSFGLPNIAQWALARAAFANPSTAPGSAESNF
jgi:hypothetical protein